ncbi:MAG: GNAT family N-acetyltransferase [Pseudomonadota bacterium]
MAHQIRPYRPGDAPGILAVHRRSIMAISTEIYSSAELESWHHGKTEEGYLHAMAEGETFLVGEDANSIAGFSSFKYHTDRTGQICGLYVDPKAQGIGLGYALLRRSEDQLRHLGALRFMIEASLAAIPFYLRVGYTITAELTHQTRGGLPLAICRVERELDL